MRSDKYIWCSNRNSIVPLWAQIAYREWLYRIMDLFDAIENKWRRGKGEMK